ncbi:hypothetical protein [Candidatus Magnetomonas plexicatena]|uniref:hypothetical protein n=1 Tax=Candidatus Magnetomonas plexicatena TaxID=2552947 RepID=UPI001C75440F|nr:hypothetical protein E2O03_003700 [Nitrospirales bacterium LBB_01]
MENEPAAFPYRSSSILLELSKIINIFGRTLTPVTKGGVEQKVLIGVMSVQLEQPEHELLLHRMLVPQLEEQQAEPTDLLQPEQLLFEHDTVVPQPAAQHVPPGALLH